MEIVSHLTDDDGQESTDIIGRIDLLYLNGHDLRGSKWAEECWWSMTMLSAQKRSGKPSSLIARAESWAGSSIPLPLIWMIFRAPVQ
jgi:hypothetical protein